jgi:transposase-like protein
LLKIKKAYPSGEQKTTALCREPERRRLVKKSSAVCAVPQLTFLDVEAAIRQRIRRTLETLLEEEIEAALGADRHERREERQGYRHGTRPARTVVTEFGPTVVVAPRARVRTSAGMEEFQSRVIERYARRTKSVDAAILSCYLAGANTRKVKRALMPLLKGTWMSKSAVSRVAGRLKEHFEAWRRRDLSGERYVVVIADAIHLPVRLARRVVRVPVQVVLGIQENGEKVLLELRVAPSESLSAWQGVMEGLSARGLPAPEAVVIDGNKGLIASVRHVWPETDIQRCTKHKYENLKTHCPRHAYDELHRDYVAITHAEDLDAAKRAYRAFVSKWSRLVPAVAESLEEAGEELLTFYRFPKEQWKSLRTTNIVERLNGEFRRRVKTQGSFATESAALALLWGLVASQTIHLRRIDGYYKLTEVKKKAA